MWIIIYLDDAIPSSRNNDGVGVVGRETNAAHPVGVTFLLDRVFTFCQCIPQLDSLVPGSRNDLTVVHGEGDAQNVLKYKTK